jgi:hypothetical protein
MHISVVWFANFTVVGLLMFSALRWGAAPERWCAAVFVLMAIVDRLYHLLVGRATIYTSVDLGHLLIDAAAAIALVWVALWANRIYPLWLAAFQGLAVVSHFTREASAAIGKLAYAFLSYAPSLFQIAILALGIGLHARRVRRGGMYPSWRSSSNPLPGGERLVWQEDWSDGLDH